MQRNRFIRYTDLIMNKNESTSSMDWVERGQYILQSVTCTVDVADDSVYFISRFSCTFSVPLLRDWKDVLTFNCDVHNNAT